jgi:hypothetical protein
LDRPATLRITSHLLVGSLAERHALETQSQSQIRRRAGAVKDAVFNVVVAANGPLQAREIHAAAQKLAGTPLSWNTVKDCLHKNARRPASPIERVGHGRYGGRPAGAGLPERSWWYRLSQ